MSKNREPPRGREGFLKTKNLKLCFGSVLVLVSNDCWVLYALKTHGLGIHPFTLFYPGDGRAGGPAGVGDGEGVNRMGFEGLG